MLARLPEYVELGGDLSTPAIELPMRPRFGRCGHAAARGWVDRKQIGDGDGIAVLANLLQFPAQLGRIDDRKLRQFFERTP